MKRIILIILAVLATNGWLWANHWTPESASYNDNMTLTGIVQINGVEQQTTSLEVGAFCGTECRGSALLAYFAPTQQYIVQMLVYGENGDPLTFKLFDHELNQELNVVSPEVLTFTTNGYGTLSNPYLLGFLSAYTITATVNPAESGTILGAGTYGNGATATLSATPNAGFAFINWTKEDVEVSTNPSYSFTVTESGTYVANFEGNHWAPNAASYDENMTLTGIIQIKGIEQQSTAYEVGVFCGDECRGSGRPVYFAPSQRHMIQLSIYGNENDTLSFKLFDHGLGQELDLMTTELVLFHPDGLGSLAEPYVLNFKHIIHFADPLVKALCVAHWDTDGDGELSYDEAEEVTALGTVFTHNHSITQFNELQYFTGLTSIGYQAFAWCTNLESILLPNTIASIGDCAFYDCRSLLSITIPASVTSIFNAGSALACGNLEEIIVEAGNTVYDSRGNCNAVIHTSTNVLVRGCKNTVIPNTVAAIGHNAYSSCTMESIHIPESVTSIEYTAFHTCENLAEITVAPENPVYDSRNNCNAVIETGTNKLIVGSKSTEIPNEITEIVDEAFSYRFRYGSYSITIPENVVALGRQAYDGGYGIVSITVLAENPPTLGNDAFRDVPGSIPVYVPCLASTAYSETDGWNAFTNYQELVCPDFDITATVQPSNAGTVTGAGTYTKGTTCTLTATPATGYHFVDWTKNGASVSTSATYSFMVLEAGAYVANFEINSYEISATANPAEGGTVTGDGTYDHFSTATLTAAASEGYTFVNWTENGSEVSTDTTYSFTVTGERTLVANFSLNAYEITATANPLSGGTVSGAGTYNHFETCTLTATPNTGYSFESWSKNGTVVSTDATYSFTVTEAGSYVAKFTLDTHTIAATANPAAGGVVTGFGTFNYGATATLTATAYPGFDFVNWTENDVEVSTAATYSFTVTADRTLVANFADNGTYHWGVDPSLYADNMSVVGIVQIDGVEQFSDALEIGAFCGDECRGRERAVYSSLVERYLVFLTVYGETGDVITFRLFDHQTDQESDLVCTTTLTFTINDMIGTAFDPYVFNFTDPTVEQVTNLTANWNWYSTYIELEGVDGLTMLEETLGANAESINSQTAFTRYYGEYGWYGSLTSINNESMYRLKMTNPATITMTGVKADPAVHPITVTKGWCHIAFLSSEPMTVATALAGLASSPGDMVKSQTRFANYYEGYGWYGSLSNAGVYINPGEGLMYKSVADEAKTFTYPATNRDIVAEVTVENTHWANDAHAYPDNMTVLAVVELDGVELGSEDYELAAFADDGCRGSIRLAYVEPLHRHAAFLTVAGDEPRELRFALYNAMTGEAVLNADERVTFAADGTVGEFDEPFVLHFRQTTGVGETAVNALVYPNPTDGDVTVEAPAMTHVTVTNTLGQVLYDADANGDQLRLDFGQYPMGLYMVRIDTANGTVIEKVSVTE